MPSSITSASSGSREGEPRRVVAGRAARRRLRRAASGEGEQLVLLAPAYNRTAAAAPPALPSAGVVFNTQSRRSSCQLGSAGRLSGPVRSRGAGRGVEGHDRVRSGRRDMGERRAARAVHDHVGMERRDDRRHEDSDVMIAAAHDKQVPPERVRAALDDLGASDKVLSIWAARRTTRCGKRITS